MTLSPADIAKQAAGRAAADLVNDGARVGVGTGTTAYWFIEALGDRVAGGLRVSAVATSVASAEHARARGIVTAELDDNGVDIAVDGADAVDPELRLIKGRGGAQVRERIVAASARIFVVIVDASKLVDRLHGAVPVEVLEFGSSRTCGDLARLTGGDVVMRRDGDTPLRSDSGNLLVDVLLGQIADPVGLAAELDSQPGVVGHGLFLGMTDRVLVGGADGVREILPAR